MKAVSDASKEKDFIITDLKAATPRGGASSAAVEALEQRCELLEGISVALSSEPTHLDSPSSLLLKKLL